MNGVRGARWRIWGFALLVGACTLVASGYLMVAAMNDSPVAAGSVETESPASTMVVRDGGPGALLFVNLHAGRQWSRLSTIELDAPDWPRTALPLTCMRIHFAGRSGLCLASDSRAHGRYAAYVFGRDFRQRHKLSLPGLPSRARVSPDGRLGAITVFVTGHSYAEGGFSTETTLVDLASGEVLGNLEDFSVTRDGKAFNSPDFNFWGVTFGTDGNLFYATLGTGGENYLVKGRVDAREAVVLRTNVECPSLSPDGTRIAFKKRVGSGLGGPVWRFHVLDLARGTETALAEPRSIDDQIEWIDDEHVLYAEGANIWMIPADGSGMRQRFLSEAGSPAAVRHVSMARLPATPATDDIAPLGEIAAPPPADLSVTLVGPRTARSGTELTYTVTIRNQGPSDASRIVYEQELPPGMTFLSAAAASSQQAAWGCTKVTERQVTCDTVSLPRGESWALRVRAVASSAGAYEVTGRIYSLEPDFVPHNNAVIMRVGID
jgi:uncharacterized repeat protein (TIGR01451 family)